MKHINIVINETANRHWKEKIKALRSWRHVFDTTVKNPLGVGWGGGQRGLVKFSTQSLMDQLSMFMQEKHSCLWLQVTSQNSSLDSRALKSKFSAGRGMWKSSACRQRNRCCHLGESERKKKRERESTVSDVVYLHIYIQVLLVC